MGCNLSLLSVGWCVWKLGRSKFLWKYGTPAGGINLGYATSDCAFSNPKGLNASATALKHGKIPQIGRSLNEKPSVLTFVVFVSQTVSNQKFSAGGLA
jgi:hypothetical protein